MRKRILSIALVLCMVLTVMPIEVFATVTTYTSGNATYAFDDDTNTLTVTATGSGETEIKADEIDPICARSEVVHLQLVTDGGTILMDKNVFGIGCDIQSVTVRGSAYFIRETFTECHALKSMYVFGDASFAQESFRECSTDLKIYGYTGTQTQTDAAAASITFVPLNGSCGATDSDNVTWKLSADGTMTINGTGAMADYTVVWYNSTLDDNRPWKDLIGMIKKVVIEDGVTKVGNKAFYECADLNSVAILGNVGSIGDSAFDDCAGLNSVAILGNVGSIGDWAFYNCADGLNMYILGSIQSIEELAFSKEAGTTGYSPLSNLKIYRCNNSVEQAFQTAGYTTFTYSQSCFVITGGKWGTDYDYDLANGVLTVLTPTPLEIKNMDASTATNHRIVVKKDMDANTTLAGVNIENSAASPFEIEKDSEGDVTITLADGTTNTLKATNYGYYAALQKEGSGTDIGKLTIQGGTLGTGKLVAESVNGAGIGSNSTIRSSSAAVSNITISGGSVMAKSSFGAGIGSGFVYGNSGSVSNITVTGGSITATSEYAVGIGSGGAVGSSGSVSNITITGGCVTATSVGSAEVDETSGGTKGTVSNITITGGSVKVSSFGCHPTDGEGNNVYLVTIPNPNGNPVIIDGKLWTPVNHTALDPTDTNLYAYSTTKNATRHTVTFNDGTNTTSYYVVGKLGNDAPATPTIPTGYTAFDGWYTAQTGGTKFDFTTAITSDIILYARFTPNTYTVSYNAGANGTGTIAAGTKTYGVDFTLSSDIFTRTGYTQTGWATTDGGEKVYDLGGSYTGNAAVTLYPVWKANQYTITVKPENGDNDITITEDYGTTVTAPTLTKDGYAFDGWDKTFPTTMPAGSMTITAKWKDITAPTGEITLGTNRWNTFLNSITFGLFFKDTQEITITATDNSGEDVTVEYLLSDKELSKTELATKTFTAYTDKFTVEPNNEYVIYAKLTDKSGNVAYINSNGIVLDNVKPVISGIEDGKTYCVAQIVTVSDKYEVTVTVNGNPVTPDTNGQFTLSAAEDEQEIVVTDKAGNQTEMTVTVNDGHTYYWQSENGQYWQKCNFCDNETAKKDIPEITINGADKVCRTQDYTFTFTLPEGVTDPKAAYYPAESDRPLVVTENDGVYTATVSHTEYEDDYNISKFFVKVYAKTADGFEFLVRKEVLFSQEHTGGTATCTHKAICEVCGEEYGEVDSGNHDLENIKGNAATVTEKGNAEYWHCKDCGKYFSDRDGKNAIDLKDTVIGKLPPEIIDGKGQNLTEGERCELIFRSNAAFGDFIRVELDGETVDGKNYTVKEGSTIVTLKADYVATLSAGEHTLGIVSESGTAEATFTVNAKAVDTNSPQTGDNNHMVLWFALLLVSGGTFAGITVYGKKKKRFVK